MRTYYLIGLLILLLVGAIFLSTRAEDKTHAVKPENFQTLLAEMEDVEITFNFIAPISPSESSRAANVNTLRFGDDYVCFGEPWNSGTRYRCTPLDNIASFTFLE